MFSAVTVVKPPGQLLGTDLVRQHLRIDFGDDDNLLDLYQQTAVALAEQFLGRALLTQTLRWVIAEAPPPGQFPLVPFTAFIFPLWIPYSLLFHKPVELPRAPAQSISSIGVGQWGQADRVLTSDLFEADLGTEPARLRLLHGAGSFPSNHLTVQFVAGYGDDPAAVPPPIKHAVLLLTAHLYENRGDADSHPPPPVKALLWPYRMMFFGG